MNQCNADELAKTCAEAMYERDVAARELGITLVEIRQAYACLKMKVREDMLNGHNICHGGFIFAFFVMPYMGSGAICYGALDSHRTFTAMSCSRAL